MIPFSACMIPRRHCWTSEPKKNRNGILLQAEGAVAMTWDAASAMDDVKWSVVRRQPEGEVDMKDAETGDIDWKCMDSLEYRRRRVKSGPFLSLRRRRKTKSSTHSSTLVDDVSHGSTQLLLQRIDSWSFNAFALDRATGGRPLPVVCFDLLRRHDLLRQFSMDPVRVWDFFSLIEGGYHGDNPYHNAIHAADVTQAMHCFLQEDKLKSCLTALEILASLIAAVAHDLDHPGVNQPFLIATANPLASLYKNASVLENHHWRSAISCLKQSGLMKTLTDADRRQLQSQIQSLILATDITRQQEFISAFREHLDNGTLDLRNSGHRHFVLQIALKCADIGNPCRPWEVSQAWSLQVTEEFYRQGDLERSLGLPVTLSCDRFASSVSKIQSGFFRFLAAPLFEEWHRFQDTCLSREMMSHLRFNQSKWDAMLQAEERGVPEQPQNSLPEDESWNSLEKYTAASRRHSMPYAKLQTQARRESLPLVCDRFVSGTSILSMTSWDPTSNEKSSRTIERIPALIHGSKSEGKPDLLAEDRSSGDESEKENAGEEDFSLAAELRSRLLLRRGSAPTPILPVNSVSARCKRRGSPPNLTRQGSLRLRNHREKDYTPFAKRRGSLPYDLDGRTSCAADEYRIIQADEKFSQRRSVTEAVCPDLRSRRGSAPGELLRITASAVVNHRSSSKAKETPSGGSVRQRRRQSFRRRKSGGPELFASAVIRSAVVSTPARLQPLPHKEPNASADKAQHKESPLTRPCGYFATSSGNHPCHSFHRRGSAGILELCAGLWNREAPEPSGSGPPSKGSSTDELHVMDTLPGFVRYQRRGSFPVDRIRSFCSSGETSPLYGANET